MGNMLPVLVKPADGGHYRHSHDTWLDEGLPKILDAMDISPDAPADILAEMLPFSLNDTTAGAENELQTVVKGKQYDVDFPLTIEASNYFKNLQKRASTGETSRRSANRLQDFLESNTDDIWENSWVRFHESALNASARKVLANDLLADKTCPGGPRRCDADRFFLTKSSERYIRVPISYLLKLALANVLEPDACLPKTIERVGEKLMGHFSNDNTSPETFSFYPAPLSRSANLGKGLARESLKRFFLTQLLVQYANQAFGLAASGQEAIVYFAPHTHTRQKGLNDLISDSFYRELFMSPCLCGWDQGEEKHRYMQLCHKVLSRSQLNAISKLREAEIITRNLVVLPSLSNLSLANNGTHISLGSRRLSALLADPDSGFNPVDEKYTGDLVIKIVEHFLPLFAGTYSAAPYRLDFQDFHPEKMLGFLPHELDFTHLRMIWRRWKKKAHLKVLGRPVTPFGPEWLDKWFSRIFRLRGDVVNDFRLLDYFVALMSTDQSPALNGQMGNDSRLKEDLADFGVFDTAMPTYMLYRMREQRVMGFSGYEGRYYSLFEDIVDDMGHAASLQMLVTALAWQWVLSGKITHLHIPDTPFVESERRQIFFGNAIGIPTFFVRASTGNQFLTRILQFARKTRMSHRYRGYVRVYHAEYQRALIRLIRSDAADLIEMFGMHETLDDLERRINAPKIYGASGKLMQGILNHAGASSPYKLSGPEFNRAAEAYYRETLRKRQFKTATDIFEEDLKRLEAYAVLNRGPYRESLEQLMGGGASPMDFMDNIRRDLMEENLSADPLNRLIRLTILTIHNDIKQAEEKNGL